MNVIEELKERAKMNPQRIVLPEPEDERILKAAAIVNDEGIAKPILIGTKGGVRTDATRLGVNLQGVEGVRT